MIPNLPLTIILRIVQFEIVFLEKVSFSQRKQRLQQLAQVCRSWRYHVIPKLHIETHQQLGSESPDYLRRLGIKNFKIKIDYTLYKSNKIEGMKKYRDYITDLKLPVRSEAITLDKVGDLIDSTRIEILVLASKQIESGEETLYRIFEAYKFDSLRQLSITCKDNEGKRLFSDLALSAPNLQQIIFNCHASTHLTADDLGFFAQMENLNYVVVNNMYDMKKVEWRSIFNHVKRIHIHTANSYLGDMSDGSTLIQLMEGNESVEDFKLFFEPDLSSVIRLLSRNKCLKRLDIMMTKSQSTPVEEKITNETLEYLNISTYRNKILPIVANWSGKSNLKFISSWFDPEEGDAFFQALSDNHNQVQWLQTACISDGPVFQQYISNMNFISSLVYLDVERIDLGSMKALANNKCLKSLHINYSDGPAILELFRMQHPSITEIRVSFLHPMPNFFELFTGLIKSHPILKNVNLNTNIKVSRDTHAQMITEIISANHTLVSLLLTTMITLSSIPDTLIDRFKEAVENNTTIAKVGPFTNPKLVDILVSHSIVPN